VENTGAVRHLGFDWKLIFRIQQPFETHSEPAYHISTQMMI